MSLYSKHGMIADQSNDSEYVRGFNDALNLADAANENAIMALRRSFLQALVLGSSLVCGLSRMDQHADKQAQKSGRKATMSEEDLRIIFAMRERGGSFVRALSWAASLADEENYARLKQAFPEIWAKYSSMADKVEKV